MDNWQERTEQLLGAAATRRLQQAHVLIVGVGGVGAWAAEMIGRAGVGEITLVDADDVQPSNINRQLPALHSTVGQSKTEIVGQRLLDINPDLTLHTVPRYMTEEDVPALLDSLLPALQQGHRVFIVDAIDTIAPKCALIAEAHRRRIPIVSSMGAGAKSDITKVQFARLEDTYHCGLSKAVRTRLKSLLKEEENVPRPDDRGVGKGLLRTPVVFSSEQADKNAVIRVEGEQNKKSTTGTISYMPAVFGCYLAEYAIKVLTSE